ncbi:MAG: hypothetical protein ACKV2T_30780, partial [Kofleriaceae bacterium]
LDINTIEIRELSADELEEIQGGWVANAVGAGVGAVSGGVSSYFASGGNWRSTLAGAAGGAVAGAFNPVGAVGTAAAQVGRAVISGGVAGAVNGALGNRNPGPAPGGQ